MKPKKILFINWKDITNPIAGGAEVVADELCKRLVQEGHHVTFLTSRYANSLAHEHVHGYEVIRVGRGRMTQAFAGLWYYIKNLRNKFDIIIDTVNTAPYFIGFFRGRSQYFLFYHQLAEEVWNYEAKPPLSFIGRYLLEPVATWLNSRLNVYTITVSQSTKDNLLKYGFDPNRIHIIREGISNEPLATFNPEVKEKKFTVLFLSALRAMKRPDHAVQGFLEFYKQHRDSQMWVVGGGDMRDMCEEMVREAGAEEAVKFFGRVDQKLKLELLQRATVQVCTSIKEGWGLIVTEANSQGTPVICYDVDGLRDAAKQGGNWVIHTNLTDISLELSKIYDTFNNDRRDYNNTCKDVLEKSREINFENSYNDLVKVLNNL